MQMIGNDFVSVYQTWSKFRFGRYFVKSAYISMLRFVEQNCLRKFDFVSFRRKKLLAHDSFHFGLENLRFALPLYQLSTGKRVLFCICPRIYKCQSFKQLGLMTTK